MDVATRYLQLLQTGYRIDEYNVVADGSGNPMVVCPTNPNRVLLYLYPQFGSSEYLYFRLDSGLLVLIRDYQEKAPSIFTTALHYSMPSMEVVFSNVFAGEIVKGFGLIKK
jgi:hypothetical protein